jgi:Bacterial Ig-like domain (group 2)
VTSVAVTPASATLLEGDSVELRATATRSDGSSSTSLATWSSGSPAVASVSSTGRVTALSAGEATITASAGDKSAAATVTVVRRVASITLNVVARAMVPGDTLALTSTARFSDNTLATGKPVTWSSSNPAAASVSATGKVTAIAAGATTVSAAVDGRVATAAITVRGPATTTLDANATTTSAIGPAGGVLTSTSGGVTYRMEIPAGALPTATQITMTPVTAVGNLTLSGGLIGAVDLQPSGLVLSRPATLRIGVAAPPRPGFTLSGFGIAGDGRSTSRAIAASRTNEVVVLITSFGAPQTTTSSLSAVGAQNGTGATAGAGFGTTQDVQSMTFSETGRPAAAEPLVMDMLAAVESTPIVASTLLTALTSWFDIGVLPQLQAATSDPSLALALNEFEKWSTLIFDLYVLPIDRFNSELTSRRSQWRQALGPKLQTAIAGNNQVCTAQRSVPAMQNVLFWQSKAEFYQIGTGALSRGTVMQGLCARLVVKATRLANPVQTNFATDLDVEYALQFGTNQSLLSLPVSVAFASQGVTFARVSPSNSDAQGLFTVAVTAQGNRTFTVSMAACLPIVGATDVCVEHEVNGSSLDITGDYTGRFSSTITTPGGVVVPVNVPLNVYLTQTQNGITGTYDVLLFNGQRGSVSAITFELLLLNFTLNQFAPCPGVISGQATFNVTTRAIASSYAGSDCQGVHTNGASTLQPGRNLTRIYSGAWGQVYNGGLLQVYKVRQTGTTVDVSHMTRSSPGLPFQCRAFYRGTVNGSDSFSADFRAPGGGNVDPPPANAAITFFPSFLVVRAADVLLANDPLNVGGQSTLLPNPPAGCEP